MKQSIIFSYPSGFEVNADIIVAEYVYETMRTSGDYDVTTYVNGARHHDLVFSSNDLVSGIHKVRVDLKDHADKLYIQSMAPTWISTLEGLGFKQIEA